MPNVLAAQLRDPHIRAALYEKMREIAASRSTVRGFGFGIQYTGGERTGRPAAVFLVLRKRPDVSDSERVAGPIRVTVDGVHWQLPVDLEEARHPAQQAGVGCRLIPGHQQGLGMSRGFGTCSAVLYSPAHGPYVATAAHVLHRNYRKTADGADTLSIDGHLSGAVQPGIVGNYKEGYHDIGIASVSASTAAEVSSHLPFDMIASEDMVEHLTEGVGIDGWPLTGRVPLRIRSILEQIDTSPMKIVVTTAPRRVEEVKYGGRLYLTETASPRDKWGGGKSGSPILVEGRLLAIHILGDTSRPRLGWSADFRDLLSALHGEFPGYFFSLSADG